MAMDLGADGDGLLGSTCRGWPGRSTYCSALPELAFAWQITFLQEVTQSFFLSCVEFNMGLLALASVITPTFQVPCQAHLLSPVVLRDGTHMSAVTHNLQKFLDLLPT